MNVRSELTGAGLASNLSIVFSVALTLLCMEQYGAKSGFTLASLLLSLVCAHFDGVRTERQRYSQGSGGYKSDH